MEKYKELTKDYKIYRTLCPLPTECIAMHESKVDSKDGEICVKVFGREHKTSRKGKVLNIYKYGDVPALTSLNQIEGFEQLTGLTTLNLSGHKIQDISGLKKLTKLRNLYLIDNRVEDIKPLASLSKLEKLNLEKNLVTDIEPLTRLKNLKYLCIRENPIENFELLEKFQQKILIVPAKQEWPEASNVKWETGNKKGTVLKKEFANQEQSVTIFGKTYTTKEEGTFLDLTYNDSFGRNITSLNEIHGLEKLTNLTKLDIGCHEIVDISLLGRLHNLKTLKELNVCANRCSDFSAIEGLTNLTELIIWSNPVQDIRFLAKLKKLERLDLSFTGIKDVSVLAELPNLKKLKIEYSSQIRDISSIKGMKFLQELQIQETGVEDISSLAGLCELKELHLSTTKIQDFMPLKQLKKLSKLYIVGKVTYEFCDVLKDLKTLSRISIWNGKSKHYDNLQRNMPAVIEDIKIVGEVISGPKRRRLKNR